MFANAFHPHLLLGSHRIERRARELIALADERRASQAQLSQDRLILEAQSARGLCASEPRLPSKEQVSSIEEHASPGLSRDKQVALVETTQSAGIRRDKEVKTLQQRQREALFQQADASAKNKEASDYERPRRETRMAEVDDETMVGWRRALIFLLASLACTCVWIASIVLLHDNACRSKVSSKCRRCFAVILCARGLLNFGVGAVLR